MVLRGKSKSIQKRQKRQQYYEDIFSSVPAEFDDYTVFLGGNYIEVPHNIEVPTSITYPESFNSKTGMAKGLEIPYEYSMPKDSVSPSRYKSSAQYAAHKRMTNKITNAAESAFVSDKASATSIRKSFNKRLSERSKAYASAKPLSDDEYLQKVNIKSAQNPMIKNIPTSSDSAKVIDDAKIDNVIAKKATDRPPYYNSGEKAAQDLAEKGMKESDKLLSKLGKYTKVALGFGATAWLVNKLSDTRGQQTNAQLYGQQQYY